MCACIVHCNRVLLYVACNCCFLVPSGTGQGCDCGAGKVMQGLSCDKVAAATEVCVPVAPAAACTPSASYPDPAKTCSLLMHAWMHACTHCDCGRGAHLCCGECGHVCGARVQPLSSCACGFTLRMLCRLPVQSAAKVQQSDAQDICMRFGHAATDLSVRAGTQVGSGPLTCAVTYSSVPVTCLHARWSVF